MTVLVTERGHVHPGPLLIVPRNWPFVLSFPVWLCVKNFMVVASIPLVKQRDWLTHFQPEFYEMVPEHYCVACGLSLDDAWRYHYLRSGKRSPLRVSQPLSRVWKLNPHFIIYDGRILRFVSDSFWVETGNSALTPPKFGTLFFPPRFVINALLGSRSFSLRNSKCFITLRNCYIWILTMICRTTIECARITMTANQ